MLCPAMFSYQRPRRLGSPTAWNIHLTRQATAKPTSTILATRINFPRRSRSTRTSRSVAQIILSYFVPTLISYSPGASKPFGPRTDPVAAQFHSRPVERGDLLPLLQVSTDPHDEISPAPSVNGAAKAAPSPHSKRRSSADG